MSDRLDAALYASLAAEVEASDEPRDPEVRRRFLAECRRQEQFYRHRAGDGTGCCAPKAHPEKGE